LRNRVHDQQVLTRVHNGIGLIQARFRQKVAGAQGLPSLEGNEVADRCAV
jgi:hypothetical protein